MKTVVLINGLPRAGKDTVADFMVGRGFKKLSFALEPKNIIARTFNITYEELDYLKNNPEIELVNYTGTVDISITFRDILRFFCSEGMKPVFGESVWADVVYKQIQESNDDLFVVPDFRFLTEFQLRPDIRVITLLVKDHRDLPTEGHSSDVELYKADFKFNYTIINDKTLEDLKTKVDNLLEGIQCLTTEP